MSEQLQVVDSSTENEFNAFNYVKSLICREYAKKKLQKKNVKEVTITMRNYFENSYVFAYLNKVGALKVAKIVPGFTEEGKQVYEVSIKDLKIDIKAMSKAGKEYTVFNRNMVNRYIAEEAIK